MSLHYEFPFIQHIDDVLPHIDDKSFKVIAKDCGNTYINYVRMGDETFPPVKGTEPERLTAKIRRECRGIAFNTVTGMIVSRPFHKFFNVGEGEDLTIEHFGFHRPHVVMDKLDGSMIRPLPTELGMRWGTKMGITDTSNLAEEYIEAHPKYRKFALRAVLQGYTPIFEFVSPENRIVARYSEPSLVLLAMRKRASGVYMDYDAMAFLAQDAGVPVVRLYDPIEGHPFDYLEAVKLSDDLDEGIVVAFDNGHRGKVKTDQYVILHRVKEKASTERNLILAILEQEIDDLLPLLPEEDSAKVHAFVTEFWHWVDSLAEDINGMYAQAREEWETKRDFAIEAQHWHQKGRSAVFTLWDGKAEDGKEVAMNWIKAGLVSETKWRDFRESLGGGTRLTRPTMKWKGKEDME